METNINARNLAAALRWIDKTQAPINIYKDAALAVETYFDEDEIDIGHYPLDEYITQRRASAMIRAWAEDGCVSRIKEFVSHVNLKENAYLLDECGNLRNITHNDILSTIEDLLVDLEDYIK